MKRMTLRDYEVLAFTFGFTDAREMKAFADMQQAKADEADRARVSKWYALQRR